MAATRFGLEHVQPTEQQHASGWRQVWRHPSGALAMRHPTTGRWVVSMDGSTLDDGFASSLHAASFRIERKLKEIATTTKEEN